MSARGVAALALLLGVALPARAQPVPVIGPGNEAAVSRMLALPDGDGCAFEGASIERRRIVGRYACPDERSVELRHVDDPEGGARRTEAFRLGGPAELVERVARGVETHEGDFRWDEALPPPPDASPVTSEGGGGATVEVQPLFPVASLLLALLLVGVAARRAPIDAAPAHELESGERLAFAGLLIVAAGARLAAAWILPWDNDEISSLPSGGAVALLTQDADLMLHPPGHRLLLAATPGISACPPRWLPRLVSVAASTGAIALLYLAARARLGGRGGLLAAALVAITPSDVFVGALTRPYALASLSAVGLLWGADAIARRAAGRRHWAGAGVALAALAWVDYLTFAVGAIGLGIALAGRARTDPSARVPSLLLGLASSLAALPWLSFVRAGVAFHLARHLARHTPGEGAESWPLGDGALAALAELGATWTGGAASALLTLALLVVGLFVTRSRGVSRWVLALALLAVLGAQVIYLRPRNLAFVTPLVAFAVAAAVFAAWRRARGVLLVAAAALLLRGGEIASAWLAPHAPPAAWVSEARLHQQLVRLGRVAREERLPVFVDTRHDMQALGRNLYDDRCVPLVSEEEALRAPGRTIGAVTGCAPTRTDVLFLYLRMPRCADPPPECRPVASQRHVRLVRCEPRRPGAPGGS